MPYLLLPCDVCDKLLPEGTKQEGGDQISNWTISGEWGNPPEAFGVFGVPVDEFEKLQDHFDDAGNAIEALILQCRHIDCHVPAGAGDGMVGGMTAGGGVRILA